MLWLPMESVAVESLPCPLAPRVEVPRTVEPSRKVTDPVIAPTVDDLTVAVKVRLFVYNPLAALDFRVVVVAAGRVVE